MRANHRAGWRARLLLAVGGMLAALVLAEGVARIVPAPHLFANRMAAFRTAVLEPDAHVGWRARAGARTTVGGIVYRFDALGCRGPEPPPGDARSRLLVVGDSMALGWGVAETETFAGRLAQQHPDIQVRNAGMVGFNLAQTVTRAAELAAVLKPQRLLVTYFPNDAEPDAGNEHDGLAWSALAQRLRPAFRSLAVRVGLAADVTRYHRDLHAPGSAGWRRVTTGLTQLGALCRGARITCTLALVPELQQQPYGLADVHARVASLARAQGLAVIDLAPSVADVPPRQLWVMSDDAHPTAEAHRRFAAALAGML